MEGYREQLVEAVKAVRIISPTAFSWYGKPSPRLLPRIERVISAVAARSFLRYMIQERLYSHFYCTGGAVPVREEVEVRPGGAAPFVTRLSQANGGQGFWAPGYVRADLPDLVPGLVAVEREGLMLVARQGEYLEDEQGGLMLRFSKELPAVSPGFYMAQGDHDLYGEEASASGGLLRIYWNVTPEGAVMLMRVCTAILNKAQVPFRLKALNDPEHYNRSDAVVLYIRKNSYEQVAALLGAIVRDLRGEMRDPVPALTLRVAEGLGLAEDPGDGGSFGLHRCRLIAEGLIRAYEGGTHGLEGRLDAVLGCLREAGIAPDAPYAVQRSRYVWRIAESERDEAPRTIVPALNPGTANSPPLAIATHLLETALRHDGMCNWMGSEVRIQRRRETGVVRREEWSTLGPDLYTGTAGVGLFLAEYAAVSGERGARDAALGAFRHAFSKATSIAPSARLGLYTGCMGIAVAALRVSIVLDAPELGQSAIALAQQTAAEQHPRHEHDLLGGSAGAIVGSLAVYAAIGDQGMLDYALRLGEGLLSSAQQVSGGGLCWPSVRFKTAAPLTGFSHGAGGIGHALLELWHTTKEVSFKEAAWGAFDYEAMWYNPENYNWPDFREMGPGQGGRSRRDDLAYAVYWCHGAPGIGLSRMRAYALTGDGARKEEAETAAAATERALRQDIAVSRGNYSLCHGHTGNATVLLHTAATPGMDIAQSEANAVLVRKVAATGAARYGGAWWPCGTGGKASSQAPGLMLGVAGIGHFYLRLDHPEIPSVLLITPEDWVRQG